jgi:hypothetical protein
MVREYLRLARPFLVMLAIVTAGRWVQGTVYKVPYEKGTHIFSLVTLTIFASLFHALFVRRWLGWRLLRTVGLGVTLGVLAQIVIVLSTVVSYAFHVDSYFSHPTALNQTSAVPVAAAMGLRAGGLVVNAILNGIAAALGWALGGLLPAESVRTHP